MHWSGFEQVKDAKSRKDSATRAWGRSTRHSREEEVVTVVMEHQGHRVWKEEVEEVSLEIGEEVGASLHWTEAVEDIQHCLSGLEFNER